MGLMESKIDSICPFTKFKDVTLRVLQHLVEAASELSHLVRVTVTRDVAHVLFEYVSREKSCISTAHKIIWFRDNHALIANGCFFTFITSMTKHLVHTSSVTDDCLSCSERTSHKCYGHIRVSKDVFHRERLFHVLWRDPKW